MAIKIASAHFGWLMRVEHSNDTETGKALTVFHWTRQKASAKNAFTFNALVKFC